MWAILIIVLAVLILGWLACIVATACVGGYAFLSDFLRALSMADQPVRSGIIAYEKGERNGEVKEAGEAGQAGEASQVG